MSNDFAEFHELWSLPGMMDLATIKQSIGAQESNCKMWLNKFDFKYDKFSIDIDATVSGDTFVSCNDYNYIVHVPIGVVFRVAYYLALMIPCSTKKAEVIFFDSPLDVWEEDLHFIPEILKPALFEYDDDSSFVRDLVKWWPYDITVDVGEELKILVNVSIYAIVFHELSHIIRNHFQVKSDDYFINRINTIDKKYSETRAKVIGNISVLKALEIDSDFVSGLIFAQDAITASACSGNNGSYYGYRLAFGLSTVLSLVDAKKRQLHNHQKSSHLAPVFRIEVIIRSAEMYFNSVIAQYPHEVKSRAVGFVNGMAMGWISFQSSIHNFQLFYRTLKLSRPDMDSEFTSESSESFPVFAGIFPGGLASALSLDEMFEKLESECHEITEAVNECCMSQGLGLVVRRTEES